MGKHLEALTKFDDFRAPWETETGDDAEIDKGKLKRYIYNLAADKAKAQDARDSISTELDGANEKLSEVEAEVKKASPDEANKKIAKLEASLKAITDERDGLVKDKEMSDLRSEVLGGVDPKIAKYVTGETREDLEANLKSVMADFGVSAEDDANEDDDEGDYSIDTQPVKALKNVSVPKQQAGDFDFDKVASEILGHGVL